MGKPNPDDPLVQMNVRVPISVKDVVATRAERIGISRDEWIRRAIEFALIHGAQPVRPTYQPGVGSRAARP